MTLSGLAAGTATPAPSEDEGPSLRLGRSCPARLPHRPVPLSPRLSSPEDPPQTSGVRSPLWGRTLPAPGSPAFPTRRQPPLFSGALLARGVPSCITRARILRGTVPWQSAGWSRGSPRPFPISQDPYPSHADVQGLGTCCVRHFTWFRDGFTRHF